MIYHMDLFSGIGGFALALRWVSETTGIPSKTIGFCDIEEFPCKVLNKHWPDVPICKDVNNVKEIETIIASYPELCGHLHGQPEEQPAEQGQQAQRDAGASIRPSLLLTGGFPCQGFSRAGKRRGSKDDRYLWPQTFAIVKAIKPDLCLFENVTGILDMVFPDSAVGMASQTSLFEADSGGSGSMGNGRRIRQYNTIIGSIMADLESEGYSTNIVVLPAVSVGAPHRRDRIWIIAYSNRGRTWDKQQQVSDKGRESGKDRGKSIRQGNREISPSGIDSADKYGVIANPISRGLFPAVATSGNIECNHRESIPEGNRWKEEDSYVANTIMPESRTSQDESNQNRQKDIQESEQLQPECSRQDSNAPNSNKERLPGQVEDGELGRKRSAISNQGSNNTGYESRPDWSLHWYEVASEFCRVHDGDAQELDSVRKQRIPRLKALGNAICVPVAYEILKAMITYNGEQDTDSLSILFR
jgi:site-specific DNA-cytosine methylase